MQFNDRVNMAIRVACAAHDGQYRRNSNVPYIAHPLAVALISQRYIQDENVFIASLFHDILEDVPDRVYSDDDMFRDFGGEVLDIVRDVTEPKIIGEVSLAWKARKEAYIAHIEIVNDIRPLIVSASDKIHNMSEVIRDYKKDGERVWDAFYADKQHQLWFFEEVYKSLQKKEGFPEQALLDYSAKLEELRSIVNQG